MATTKQARKIASKPAISKCANCGKVLTNSVSITNAQGHKCLAITGNFTAAQLQAHKAHKTLPSVPVGYIKTALLHKKVQAAKNAGLAVSISKMVSAFGGDRGISPQGTPTKPIHVVYNFWYVQGHKARYIHAWCGTQAGLQALASGNFTSAPSPPANKTAMLKALKANKNFSV
jgi:hypothetical protein